MTSGDMFDIFSATQVSHATSVSKDNLLFQVDVPDIWQIFLQNLPAGEQQHHTCNACRHFVVRYGNLVSINATKGTRTAVMWPDPATVPDVYRRSAEALKKAVERAEITGVFFSDVDKLGTPSSNGWTHMWAPSVGPSRNKSRSQSSSQRMAEVEHLRTTLLQGLHAYPEHVFTEAFRLLNEGQLYRHTTMIPRLQWLMDMRKLDKKSPLFWLNVATAPNGFCNVGSSVLDLLFKSVQDQKPFAQIQAQWQAALAPEVYQRPQSAPAAGTIATAEKLFASLGLAPALKRRQLSFSEIPSTALLWQPPRRVGTPMQQQGGIFSHIQPKTPQPVPPSAPSIAGVPPQTMTWSKFSRTILPTAHTIEVKVKAAQQGRFFGLVGPVDPEAPNILQWDNGVSWYYHSGADGEMRRRVLEKGGVYDNVEIRATLLWNTRTDLDLHATYARPGQSVDAHIYYANKQAAGGYLDVDANVVGDTLTPVENIRWAQGRALAGTYSFFVVNYNSRDPGPTPFHAEVSIAGHTYVFSGALRHRKESTLIKFTYNPNNTSVPLEIISKNPSRIETSNSSTVWSLPVESWAPVRAVTLSPNRWESTKQEGGHTFFFLQGCVDTAQEKGRGFFPEMMRSDLHSVRSVVEAYLAADTLEAPPAGDPACGIGFANEGTWNVELRVNGSSIYLIDRIE